MVCGIELLVFALAGIVGRISPVTWRAVEMLLAATATNDYNTMARALVTIGATNDEVDIPVCAAACGFDTCMFEALFSFTCACNWD